MKNLHPKQNINLFKENRFCYQSGGEVVPKVAEQLDTSKKEKDPIEQLDARQATDLLKDPDKLFRFMMLNERYDRSGRLDSSESYSDKIKKVVAKIMTDQSALKEVADSMLDPNKTLINITAIQFSISSDVMTSVIKSLNPAEDYAKKILDNPKFFNLSVTKAALLKITDVPYKVGKIKAVLTQLSTKEYVDRMGKEKAPKTMQVTTDSEYPVARQVGNEVITVTKEIDEKSYETVFAETLIRSIKDGAALNELSNFVQDIQIPKNVPLKARQLVERQQQHLISVIFDQRDWKSVPAK